MSIVGNPLALGGSGGGSSGTLIQKTITQNGIYNASSDNADGYSRVTVALTIGTRNISTNKTYNAIDDNLAGYSSVVVNVPQTISGGRCPRTEQTYTFQYLPLLSTVFTWTTYATQVTE